jgi:hypothetical protein
VTNGKYSSVQKCDIMQNISTQVLQSVYYSPCRKPVFAYVIRCDVVSVSPDSSNALSASVFRERLFPDVICPTTRRHVPEQHRYVEPKTSLGLSEDDMGIPAGRGDYAEESFLYGCYSNSCVCGLRSHRFATPSAETDHVYCKLQRK